MRHFMVNSIEAKDKKLVDLFYIGYSENDKTFLLHNDKYVEVKDNESWTDKPTFSLPLGELHNGVGQAMVEHLISMKIYPQEWSINNEKLKLAEKYAEDLRNIIFKILEIKLEKSKL